MKLLLSTLYFWVLVNLAFAQQTVVQFSGKMSKIRQEGRVDAAIIIDTIHANHLYAVGPVENLLGEIFVWDNRAFVAGVTPGKKPFVLKDVKNLGAIFLVYADVAKWDTIQLPVKIKSIAELQNAITQAAFRHGIDTVSAFPFLIFGKVKQGSGHIIFKDTTIKQVTPATLKAATHTNTFTNQNAQLLGFYSQHHQTIFTHHDSYLHIHYRLGNKYQAGHLEQVAFDPGEPIKLLLPTNKK